MLPKKKPERLQAHGHVRTDDYYWLRERENPEVIAYLEAENAHTEKTLAKTKGLQDKLFDEIKNRMKPDDASAPYRLDDYYYNIRFTTGQEYPLHCRRKGSIDAPEHVFLDVNALAKGHEYFHLGKMLVSSGQDRLAYAIDTVGRRKYDIHFRDIATGEPIGEVIPEVTGSMAWAADNKTLFYARQHPETLRSYRIYRHELGTDPASDVLVYEEQDETFHTYVFKTKSKRFIVIGSAQTVMTEYRYFDANDPSAEPIVFAERRRDHEYEIDHHGDHFYIITNDRAKNFRLMRTRIDQREPRFWEEVIPHRDDVYLEGFELFDDYLVLEERIDGLMMIRIVPRDGDEPHYLDFGEPAYDAYLGINNHFDTRVLRYGYTSMTTPSSVYEYDMKTREKKLIKREEVMGEFEPGNYRTERLHATAPDGEKVPISLVYRPDQRGADGFPLLLYGYGSYGHSLDASFNSSRLSLLDRGFAFAVAHIRGGQELGRAWYEDGKLDKKPNTFTDFIACAEHLVEAGVADREHLYAMGGSAGGLLMGAVMNLRPELFHGVIAVVPFVDVVTTMLDESIPLTTGEYDEWGDPRKKKDYELMLSYSPYDNVTATAYPHLLVTTGLHDSQVQYWEPAKWVAKLRELKTDNHLLLLKTDMEVGHSGATGRYKQHRDTALYYAFLLHLSTLED